MTSASERTTNTYERALSEVEAAYLRVAELSEATLSPSHAVDIAEWIVRTRHPWRERFYRLFRYSPSWWQAQAIRERHARQGWS